MKKRLALNTASNMATLFIKLAITFVMTPILIKNLGHYDYGIWEMVGAIIGYMGMLDLGVRPAISRFAARFIALKDQESLSLLYATSWFFLMAVGFFIFFILSIWGIYFSGSIAEDGSESTRYTLLLIILAIQLLISFPAYTAESFMESYQEYYLKNNITIINSFIGFGVIYYYIEPENALVLLALVNTIGTCIKYIFLVWYVQYRRPFLKIKAAYFRLENLKTLLSFSVKTLIQGVSTRIENATDSLVIGFALGPAMVPIYSIPANLLNHIRGISITLTHVFMPYLSGLSALNDQKKIQEVYFSSSKIMVSLSLIMLIGAIMMGERFLQLWVGEQIASSAGDLILIIAAFTVLPLLNPLSNRYLTAIDKHVFLAKWQPVVALANLILSLILVYPMGIFGVALGSLIPSLFFQPILLYVCCSHLNVSIGKYISHVFFPWIIPSLGMILLIFYLQNYFIINSFGLFFLVALSGTVAFFVLALFFSFNLNERLQLISLIKKNYKQ
jgi:O-antigen/teichoic acid export membrane protein